MGFDVVKTQPVGKRVLASVSYRRAKRGGLPRLIIGVSGDLLEGASISNETRFWIAFGTGTDNGRARIGIDHEGKAAGTFQRVGPKRAGGRFNFGFVEALGTDIADKEECGARRCARELIGGDLVEIDCPWLKVEASAPASADAAAELAGIKSEAHAPLRALAAPSAPRRASPARKVGR